MNLLKLAISAIALTLASTGFAGDEGQWAFEIEPYIFATSIDGDTSVGRANGLPVEISTSDILETLNSALMLHFEGFDKSNGWGFIADYSFMDMRDEISASRRGVLSTKLRQGVLELDVFRRYEVTGGLLDYTAGVRWWDNDIEAQVDIALLPGSPRVDIKQDWVDFVVGMRWQKPINDSWAFVARGDIGGFGFASNFTSQAIVGAKYNLNESFLIDISYKAVWVDYETGNKNSSNYFAYDTVTHGPLVGLIYKF
jgi:hypothetical protein